ncbi:MAG: hypothetical protein HC854_04505 [Flavobacterium sp.]|nr:hypothetical protein [Flavobacterium sp.]
MVELMEFKDVTKNPLLKKYNNYTAFENKKIVTILDEQQLLRLLTEKNRKNATQLAYENWDELEAKEMTNNLDKKQTIKEFAIYLLNYLVATDRLKMNKNATNIFYKRDVELKKPDLLKQLDEIKKTEQSNKNTKNALNGKKIKNYNKLI